ncbi:ribonuclease J [Acidocella sp.]|uniref:ribonuclease J n=1 Tax=Acidocella sp. TaxID=50710 RepID=UPI00262624E3|nr:ribonuclease J [Acidocella sp.]
MSRKPKSDQPDGSFIYVPLGGTGEIGMNFNLYGCDGAFIAVDCGIGFTSPETPEAEILLPDPSFIAGQAENLLAIVVTHAHEDHIGGIARLWPQLRCPVYATPFAAALIRRKLTEAGLQREVKLHIVPPGGALTLGPFAIRYIGFTHSIPEAHALAITTRYGTVLHTGDWKLDPNPQVGPVSDEAALKELGDRGVLAIISDSTNIFSPSHSGSEADVAVSLEALIEDLPGRVAVTCFASNIARLQSVIRAGEAAGRHIALVGRSLTNYIEAAKEAGYLKNIPDLIPEDAIGAVPDENLLLLVTGSQGEPRSALARIAADSHRHAVLGEGDTVVFSSRMIPGNERAIMAMQDGLSRRGINIITDRDEFTHVSGHPGQQEVRRLYELVRPQYVIPTHGEWRHLSQQAAFARNLGIETLLIENGDVVELAPNRPQVVDSVPTGRLAVDGDKVVPLKGGVLTARKRMLFNGVVVGSVVLDKKGKLLGQPRISAPGLLGEEDNKTLAAHEAELREALQDLPAALRLDEDAFPDSVRALLRRIVGKRLGKRPLVEAHILRV